LLRFYPYGKHPLLRKDVLVILARYQFRYLQRFAPLGGRLHLICFHIAVYSFSGCGAGLGGPGGASAACLSCASFFILRNSTAGSSANPASEIDASWLISGWL